MKIPALRIAFLITCIVLSVGCRNGNENIRQSSVNNTLIPAAPTDRTAEKPQILAGPDARMLVCMFVAYDNAGHSGYVAIDGHINSPYPGGDVQFQTIGQVRDAIKNKYPKIPEIITYDSEFAVYEDVKSRGLTVKEMAELGLSGERAGSRY